MRHVFAIAMAASLLVACTSANGGADQPVDNSSPAVKGAEADGILRIAPGIASGPGITIEDALARAGTGPLLVNGSLFVDDGGAVLLCSAIAESFPPQCGGARLVVRGLDLSSVADIQEANGVRWADQVQLLGTVSLIEG